MAVSKPKRACWIRRPCARRICAPRSGVLDSSGPARHHVSSGLVRTSLIVAVLVLACGGAQAQPVSSSRITSDAVRVIDGDTIRIRHERPDVRLVGFNAPETRRANCPWERELGDKATRRLRDVGLILIRENLAVSFVCGQTSCPPTPKPWCN
jgi:endonuclease YncB( thermonuclease family)